MLQKTGAMMMQSTPMDRLSRLEMEVHSMGNSGGAMMLSNGSTGASHPDARDAEHNKKYDNLVGLHKELLVAHRELLASHRELASTPGPTGPSPGVQKGPGTNGVRNKNAQQAGMAAAACLGVIRLDYDYPPAPGDIDCPKSFGYDVFYHVVPGLTFTMCQSGKMTDKVEQEFEKAIDWLVAKGVSGITGDCGFMMYFQQLARRKTQLPVFMSALCQLPAITCGFNHHELIAIFTANDKTLKPMRGLLKEECGVDPDERRFVIVGCEHVTGFEAVADGGKVNVKKVTPGMVELAKEMLIKYPKIRAILLECTELPPYGDALRMATMLPVYDAITCCNMFMAGRQDNPLFGLNSWQQSWDGVQEEYQFGKHLDTSDRRMLVNHVQQSAHRGMSRAH